MGFESYWKNIMYNWINIILFFSISILAIHQKGFIFYILSSHVSFLLILKIYHVIWPFLSDLQKCSYRNKLCLFILSLTCMSLMAYFYYRHFIHCDPFGKLQLSKFRSLTSKCYIMYWWSVFYQIKISNNNIGAFLSFIFD